MEGEFRYAADLLKHHVRVHGWLPSCKRRVQRIRGERNASQARKLRYFTFCAVNAVDVLLLDVERVITPSPRRGFDTVVFVDRDPELVRKTRERIPGARGIPGNFVDLVLSADHEGATALQSPEGESNTLAVRDAQRRRSERSTLVESFPFDVINLDLQDYFFRPSEPPPGRLIEALSSVFEWQHRTFHHNGRADALSGFTLLFTTRVGPPNLYDSQAGKYMREIVAANVKSDPALRDALRNRTGTSAATRIQRDHFEAFFAIGMPKALVALLTEHDWRIEIDNGLRVYEFVRGKGKNAYTMLHLVIDVAKPRMRRFPGRPETEVSNSYREATRLIFGSRPETVDAATIDEQRLRASLAKIEARAALRARSGYS